MPLRIATWLGVFAGLVAILVAVWAVYVRLLNVSAVPGWATIMIAVTLAASAQLLMTGILGEYVGRIYEEVKRRPLYIIQDRIDAYAGEPSELDIRAGAALATPHPSLVPRADTRAVLDGD